MIVRIYPVTPCRFRMHPINPTPSSAAVAGPQYTKRFEKFDKYKQHYYGCVTAMDEQIGRLRKELGDLGVAENTMLWFCSDNGPEGNQHAPGSTGGLRGRKRDLFESGIRVPGLLEWPAKVKPGSVTDLSACTSDYLPTVLDMLGLKMPDDRPIDGISLLPLFEGNMKHRSKSIGFESEAWIALIEDRYKLIGMSLPKELTATLDRKKADKENVSLAPAMMLFDLIDDPAETHDIAGKHPEIVKRLTATLNAWRDSCTRSLAGNDYPGNDYPGNDYP